MNLGIKKAISKLIGILNSDDIYYKNTLKIVNYISIKIGT